MQQGENDAAIERVESRNPVINAVVRKLYDQGRRTIAAGLPDGPLTGVPFLLKDIGALTTGVLFSRASPSRSSSSSSLTQPHGRCGQGLSAPASALTSPVGAA